MIKKHKVAIIAYDDVVISDISTPHDLFSMAKKREGRALYDVRVCAINREFSSMGMTIKVKNTLRWAHGAQTIIIPGSLDIKKVNKRNEILKLIKTIHSKKRIRIASICTGAFLLAESGILDGVKATTHWLAFPEFKKKYPNVELSVDSIYVDNGEVLTSAGATTAFDLCLHMIRDDFGETISRSVSSLSVLPFERIGLHSQLGVCDDISKDFLNPNQLSWIEQNLAFDLSIQKLAELLGKSERSLSRHFIKYTGLTPARWITYLRIRKAKSWLEETDDSIEDIAGFVGYKSAEVFRENFRRAVNVSPSEYRSIYVRRYKV